MSSHQNLKPMNGSAFSLIELLTVMAIVSVMMALSVPAFNVLKSTGDISTAAYDIASTLEQARAYAMANNTFVYVGFAERAQMDATKPGEGQILISAMGSKSGSRNFDSKNLGTLTSDAWRALKVSRHRKSDSARNACLQPPDDSHFFIRKVLLPM